MLSIDGIKLKSIQVAASYTEREDPRKIPTILVAFRTEGKQTTRLNLKINLTNEKTYQDLYCLANVEYSSTFVIYETLCLSAFLFLELGRQFFIFIDKLR